MYNYLVENPNIVFMIAIVLLLIIVLSTSENFDTNTKTKVCRTNYTGVHDINEPVTCTGTNPQCGSTILSSTDAQNKVHRFATCA